LIAHDLLVFVGFIFDIIFLIDLISISHKKSYKLLIGIGRNFIIKYKKKNYLTQFDEKSIIGTPLITQYVQMENHNDTAEKLLSWG
jgi:hypothetical protein